MDVVVGFLEECLLVRLCIYGQDVTRGFAAGEGDVLEFVFCI